MKRLFGTDGMRGEAGIFPLDTATMETVGMSLATHLKHKLGRVPLIVIGRDTRESGAWLAQALTAGVVKAGGQSKSAGVITTPGVAFLARTIPTDAGIVISASHNVYSDNGLKIFAPSGRKLDEETERLIEHDVFAAMARRRTNTVNPPPPTTRTPQSAGLNAVGSDEATLRTRYLEFLVNEIGCGMDINGTRLVLDCANGAASGFAAELFERLGANVTTISDYPDGRNINQGCGSLHMEDLQHQVLIQNADIGVAFDGDADRSLFVDAKGRLIDGDSTLWVLARYLKARHQLDHDTVVATVMSNIGLEIALKSEGLRLIRTDVGDKFVLEELIRLGASLGGEQSGHIIFPRLSLAGDGLVTTLCVLRAMTEDGRALHELTEGFQTFPQILVNVAVKVKEPFAKVAAIKRATQNIESELGLRGRLLLRYSGTEPLARVMVEGEDQNEIEKYANDLAKVIRENLGI
jgi:phosphoglucosamine mutase